MPPTIHEIIHSIPKCELHVHLEGCLTPTLAQTLATRNNIALPPSLKPTSNNTSKEPPPTYAFHDLTTFLAIYYPALTILQQAQDFHDLAWSYLVKAAAQNTRHVELFFDPQAHTSRGIPFATVLTGYHTAVTEAKSNLSMSAGLIMCILRDHPVSSADETLTQALVPENRARIIGLGLDSDERDNPPRKFAGVFARARLCAPEWKLTMHCDIDQPGTLTHIRQALLDIRVDRIDHGTNVVDAPDLVATLKDRNVGLTCCPISNSVVTPDFKGKEIVALMRDGVKVTVNSDDPAYFGGYVEENIVMVVERMGLGWRDVVTLQRNAFEIAWLGEEERQGFVRELDEFERRVEGELGGGLGKLKSVDGEMDRW